MYGQLNELRESIMNKVMTNQDLLKFIYYCNTDDKTDILSLPNLTKDQRKSLINTQIFKYKRMPLNSQTDAKCFLSMQYLGVNRNRKEPYWMMPYFEFTVVSSNSIDETLHFLSNADTATSPSGTSLMLNTKLRHVFCIGNHDPMSRISWPGKMKCSFDFAMFANY